VREQRFDTTEVGSAQALGITELSPAGEDTPSDDAQILADQIGIDHLHAGLVDHDFYASIYNPGKMLVLTCWQTEEAAAKWQPMEADFPLRHRRMRTIREYGMFDRRETPQYFPLVPQVVVPGQGTRFPQARN